jgi:DNA ligase-1
VNLGGRDIALRCVAAETERTLYHSARESEFLAFANIGETIAATPAKLEKIRLLADYARGLPSEQLPIATLYFTGRAFAQNDLRTLQVGWAIIFRALQAATNIGDAELHRIASAHGDAGRSAFEILDGRTAPQPFSISESRELFQDLHRARGPNAKAKLLQNRYPSCRRARQCRQNLTGDLRIGCEGFWRRRLRGV